MKCAFHAVVFAALLAGCGAAKQDDRNDKDTFGQSFTWEWRQQNAAVGAKPPGPTNKEREEFEAWQEWKRKNAK